MPRAPAAMQCAGRIISALLLAVGVTSSRLIHNGHQKPRHGFYTEDVEACVEKMNQYFTAEHPTHKDTVRRMLVDSCNGEELDLRPTVCPHMDRVVTDSLWKVMPATLLSPADVCERTEAHMTELQGVARVPRVGSGMIHISDTKKTCEPTVEAALDGAPTISSSSVPNFWYALCMNQDCAHMLPSRTKWCNISRPPSHSAAVCAAARTFALRHVESQPPYYMGHGEVCGLFSAFHKEMATDVAAYRRVLYGEAFPRQYVKHEEKRGWSPWSLLGYSSTAALRRPPLWAFLGPLLSVLELGRWR